MIKLELELTDLNYDQMLELLLPRLTDALRSSGNPLGMLLSNGMGTGMAKKVWSTLSQEQKDKLVVDLLNANQAKLAGKAEEFAAHNGIQAKVSHFQASAK